MRPMHGDRVRWRCGAMGSFQGDHCVSVAVGAEGDSAGFGCVRTPAARATIVALLDEGFQQRLARRIHTLGWDVVEMDSITVVASSILEACVSPVHRLSPAVSHP